MTSSRKTLEELNLLKCSLLPGELLEFLADSAQWTDLLDAYAHDPDSDLPNLSVSRWPPVNFQLKLEASSDLWYEIALSPDYGEGSPGQLPVVSVKGDSLGRAEQERWQRVVANALESVHGSDTSDADRTSSSRYHALFTSHHLKSPQKRRSLAQWAHELALSGFAKVGHPGVIYCEGARADVEDFVARVKSMQWLALRLRFVEPAPSESGGRRPGEEAEEQGAQQRGGWAEFEKVGEVVEEMRRLGRESFVVESGVRATLLQNR
ncbi:hypothetical protein C8T65DRAFT_574048 [Cerioporus squamosus]|nr:hypothetical protein C8T65DRAFT_574048 [Cerioporus squamosus]